MWFGMVDEMGRHGNCAVIVLCVSNLQWALVIGLRACDIYIAFDQNQFVDALFLCVMLHVLIML